MRRASVVIAVAVVLAIAGEARANKWNELMRRINAGAWLHYELTGLTVAEEPDPMDAPPPRGRELVLAGVRLHGFIARNRWIAYHVGLDLAAGATVRGGGFAYDVALFPVGAVVRLGQTSFVGVAAGVGAMGATGTLDDAAMFPVEALAELGRGVRVLARARIAYVAGAAGRGGGAPSVPFADEVDAMLGLRLGRAYKDFDLPSGNGYFIAASYRELGGARFVGATIGYSIDMALPRRRRQY